MIKNYTTSVNEEKTVGEIMALLAEKGARSIRIDYDDKGRPSGVSFVIVFESVPVPFKLPCNFNGVQKAMIKEAKRWQSKTQEPQVRRIAWRIVKDWCAAQMALIEGEQATLAQVFLPYAMYQDGLTAYDRFMESISKNQLTVGTPE